MENWKPVKGYEGIYEVSDQGRIKSIPRKVRCRIGHRTTTEKILKPGTDRYGYLRVCLCNKGNYSSRKIHKLVAIAFLGHVHSGLKIVVDHIDNNKLNNRLDNLQLITHRLNISKDRKNKTSKYIGVSWYKRTKKWRSCISINGKYKHLGFFHDEMKASEAYQKALNAPIRL